MIGLGVVMTLATLTFMLTQTTNLFGGRSAVQLESGDPVFRPGSATNVSKLIATGGPIVLQDPTGGDRDIWLNHLGATETEGWFAFGARPLSAPRSCSAQWQAARKAFVDSCDGTAYPADGTGLPQFPVAIGADGQLSIRLDTRSASTSSTGPGST